MPQEAASEARLQDRDKRGLPVALNPTPTRWTVHLVRPTACPRITPFRTSCGRPDPATGVACGAFGQPVRHCRGHHAVHREMTAHAHQWRHVQTWISGETHADGVTKNGNINGDTHGTTTTVGGSQPHTHTLDGASGEANGLPPYYVLSYVMRCA